MGVALESRVAIRRAQSADAAFFAHLGQEAFGDFDLGAREHTLGIVSQAGMVTLVATVDAQPVGFVSLELGRGGVGHVQAIAVRSQERGRGFGQRLLVAAERHAEKRGVRVLHLTTAQANVEAIALFLKCGFTIERRLRRFYSRGQDACTMVKELAG